MKRLLMGDKATAIAYFHKCLATGQTDFFQYILARAELQALEPTPASRPTPTPIAPAGSFSRSTPRNPGVFALGNYPCRGGRSRQRLIKKIVILSLLRRDL